MRTETAVATLLVATSAVAVLDSTSQQATTSEPPRATVALVEAWPDGRVNYELTSTRRAVMWTPQFPRLRGYTPPEGTLPVYAVQFARVLVGGEIKVDVSVLLGSATPPGVAVATVTISRGSHVVVNALAKFGVQPVTLSMVDVGALTPFLPTVVSVSSQVEIANVELLTAPYPGYRITLRNLGSKRVSTVHVQSYRGRDKALSALKRADDGRPMMEPGGSYTFDMNLTSGRGDLNTTPGTWTPQPIDVIEFDSVRWDDGTSDGASPFPQIEPIVESDAGRRVQLKRIVDALRATIAEQDPDVDVLAAAKLRLESLADAEPDQVPLAQSAMRSTKDIVISDIARFDRQRTTSGLDVRQWLTALPARYETWLARLSPP
jgi:hypothetical protein